MVLVIVSMLVVLFGALVGIIASEVRKTSDDSQKERIYQATESGVQRALFLVGDASYTIDMLAAQYPVSHPVLVDVTDPVSGDAIGSYATTVEPVGGSDEATLRVVGTSENGRFCSQVTVHIARPSGNPTGQYLASGWSRSSCL